VARSALQSRKWLLIGMMYMYIAKFKVQFGSLAKAGVAQFERIIQLVSN